MFQGKFPFILGSSGITKLIAELMALLICVCKMLIIESIFSECLMFISAESNSIDSWNLSCIKALFPTSIYLISFYRD